MTKEQEYEICRKAVETYGVISQLNVAMEECAELIKALNENTNIAEEVADVEIMIKQLRIIFGDENIDNFETKTNVYNKEFNISCLCNLIQAISKYFRDNNKKPYKEIAIVEFMCFAPNMWKYAEYIEEQKEYKLNRLSKRLEGK